MIQRNGNVVDDSSNRIQIYNMFQQYIDNMTKIASTLTLIIILALTTLFTYPTNPVYAESTFDWDSPQITALASSLTSPSTTAPPSTIATTPEGTSTATTTTAPTTAASTNPSAKVRYWDGMKSENLPLIQELNEKLLDYAVGTINTMYYDNTGGARFNVASMTDTWRLLRMYNKENKVPSKFSGRDLSDVPKDVFSSRDNAVGGLKWLVVST